MVPGNSAFALFTENGITGAAIALPTQPLEAMYGDPARDFIESRGGTIRTGAPAKIRVRDSRVAAVEAAGEKWSADRVIAAVPWFAIGGLFDAPPEPLAALLDRARGMASSPIVTVNLWFDRPIMDEPIQRVTFPRFLALQPLLSIKPEWKIPDLRGD